MPIIARDGRVLVRWPASRAVGMDGVYRVFGNDGAGGSIDYDSPVVAQAIVAWGEGALGYCGFGLGALGAGAFGTGERGFGFGERPFGLGPFGYDTKMLNAGTRAVRDGDYSFAVVGYDEAGNDDVAPRNEAQIDVAGVPRRSGRPEATAYDDSTDTLSLQFGLSADDET